MKPEIEEIRFASEVITDITGNESGGEQQYPEVG
jgi:hypothetical protein